MLYLHDAWVNWFEGEENGYNVCPFHEWRKSDSVELLDQVPLLYISSELFEYIENDIRELPKDLLDSIYKRATIRKGQKRTVLEYAAVVTDGMEILAFDTAGYYIPVRKSRLIPRQEQLVYSMIEKAEQKSYGFKSENYQKEYHMLSMPPSFVHGLTRRERQLKQLLMIGLDQLKTTNDKQELRYWLTEWNPKKYPSIKYMNEEEVWDALYNGLKDGWSQAHEELCKKLIRGQAFLERMWEAEMESEENTSKQN
ncbi:YjbA family protein [Oceanobacillus jeddahense]|uniref:YjbA family protein n=1 Tax=Oceanobacillus jeddahense TaxID=1462527 RepID=A0ABY5JNB8_9BACI|nr:YjbA family protein [Oceanobacillus jeddahense]UUI01802.1 YjbA family protein [Oceanobacillus jeddahense]